MNRRVFKMYGKGEKIKGEVVKRQYKYTAKGEINDNQYELEKKVGKEKVIIER